MTQQATWNKVDWYFDEYFIADDPVLRRALQRSDEAELPQINVAPNQGKFLMFLAQMQGAKRILEVGTLGGYSTIWLARALPADGHLITLELEKHHAEVARHNIADAGLADKVDIRVGMAVDSMAQLAEEGKRFDFIFIDADKPSNPDYLRWSLQMVEAGALIILDNVVRAGEVIDPNHPDERVQGVRRVVEMIADEPRLDSVALQMVGGKGYDGMALLRVIK